MIDALGPAKVCAVVTDNAASNLRAWESLMNKYREQRIMCYGCSAHWFNLVVQDIMGLSAFATLKDQYVEIIRFFKEQALAKGRARGSSSERIQKNHCTPSSCGHSLVFKL